MNASRLIAVPFILLGAASAVAHGADDYPTHETVEYVIDCMRQYGGMTYDNLYKCSCSFDYIASKMTHDEFIMADTFMRGQAAAGERPEILREGELAEGTRASYEEMQVKAARHCFLPVQAEAEKEPEDDD